ncbi:MAG: DUF1697 domain-containing protein [Acidobacteriota bacterium]|nr:DUF1697 domain-containing protein [Acidobacteriota bacterium]
MPVYVSLLRGINLGEKHRVAMEDLRALYASQGMNNARTYIQSGNVVFHNSEKDASAIARPLNRTMEKKYGFRADAVLRTLAELEALVTANPLAVRDVEPTQNIVVFLSAALDRQVAEESRGIAVAPEEVHTDGRHLFCYYPNGQGRSKLGTAIDRHLRKLDVNGTARNWNTVLKLLEMAREMERSR